LFPAVGVALYRLPFFYDVLVQDLGWTRQQVTSATRPSKPSSGEAVVPMGVAALRDRTGRCATGFDTSSAGGAIAVPAARRVEIGCRPGRRRELD